MREIKFRAWDGAKMLTDHQIGFVPPILSNAAESMATAIAAVQKKHSLMQFTGLNDKTGREIYEGDIIKVRHNDGKYDTGEVVYGKNGGAFCVGLPKVGTGIRVPLLNYMRTMGLVADWDCEIIGNVYENSSLLGA